MKSKLQRWIALLAATALAVVSIQMGLAATTIPVNLTPTAPYPEWTGTQWELMAASDTLSGEYICVEFAVRDSSNLLHGNVRYRGVYSYSTDNSKVYSFLITPPPDYQNVQSPNAITYQFYIINSSAGGNCYAASSKTSLYTGYNWSFTWNINNDPSAVKLTSLEAAPQPTWLFGVGLVGGVVLLVAGALAIKKLLRIR